MTLIKMNNQFLLTNVKELEFYFKKNNVDINENKSVYKKMRKKIINGEFLTVEYEPITSN